MCKNSAIILILLISKLALATEVNLLEKAQIFKELSLQAHKRSSDLTQIFKEGRIVGNNLAVPLQAKASLREANIIGGECPDKIPQAQNFLCLNKNEVTQLGKLISENARLSLAYNDTYLKALAATQSPESLVALRAELEREKAYMLSFKQKHDELKGQLEEKSRNKYAMEQNGPLPVKQYKWSFGRKAFMDISDQVFNSFIDMFLFVPPLSCVVMFFFGLLAAIVFSTLDVLILAYGGIFWIISQVFFQGSYYTPIKQAEGQIKQLEEKLRDFPKLEILENQILMKSDFLSLAEREALKKTPRPTSSSLP